MLPNRIVKFWVISTLSSSCPAYVDLEEKSAKVQSFPGKERMLPDGDAPVRGERETRICRLGEFELVGWRGF